MSISVPAARLTPSNPGGPGLSGWADPPHGFGVAPGARVETGPNPCEVKKLEAQAVLARMAADWAEQEGDRGRLYRLQRHGEEIERRLAAMRLAIPSPLAGEGGSRSETDEGDG